jgi:hypothetical protein
VLAACGGGGGGNSADGGGSGSGIPEPGSGCNPIIGDDCISPFPSSFYEAADTTTATGVRLQLPDSALPQTHGTALTGARFSVHDGVSPSTPFVVYIKAGVDATQLPTLATLDQSILPTSAVQVIDFTTGARVPVMAELDANAQPSQRQALIIRPQVRLANNTRYIIALVGLNDKSGAALAPAPFVALRDKTTLNTALTALAPRYEDIFTALASAGVTRSSVTLAWDVITASDADLTGHLVSMRDTALPMVPSLTWTVTSSTDTGSDANRAREVIGTFQVPSFLTDDSETGTLDTDGSNHPVLRGLGSANFVVDIPACAKTATGPIPVMVYGHGLFGTAPAELESAYGKQVGNFLCMIEIGTDWLGLAQYDFTTIANDVVPDFNRINIITDRLQQAHINAQVLTRLFITKMKDDPAFQLGSGALTDGSDVYYLGNSNGGIQGVTYMALSEDVTRGVLIVPGCEWSDLMFRSQDFGALQLLLGTVLPDPADQQVLLTLLQPDFDYTDPASFAPHIFGDRLPNVPAKQLLLQESVNDAEVPNIATRVLARTLGVPGLDLEQPVYGVTAMSAPLASAYTQWDVMPTPIPPVGNTPASMDNGAHAAVHPLSLVEQQDKAFLTPTGMVTHVCSGSDCVCSLPDKTCEYPAGVSPD